MASGMVSNALRFTLYASEPVRLFGRALDASDAATL
jgi:hypothetical protein